MPKDAALSIYSKRTKAQTSLAAGAVKNLPKNGDYRPDLWALVHTAFLRLEYYLNVVPGGITVLNIDEDVLTHNGIHPAFNAALAKAVAMKDDQQDRVNLINKGFNNPPEYQLEKLVNPAFTDQAVVRTLHKDLVRRWGLQVEFYQNSPVQGRRIVPFSLPPTAQEQDLLDAAAPILRQAWKRDLQRHLADQLPGATT